MADETQKSAGGVLRRRYIKDDEGRAGAVERERVSAEVAQLIHDRRTSAGLTQKQLADLLGTRQSVISRLEDADYAGHSLGMLQRVAGALGQRLHVQMTPLAGDQAHGASTTLQRGSIRKSAKAGGALSRAIAPENETPRTGTSASVRRDGRSGSGSKSAVASTLSQVKSRKKK